MAHPEYLYWFLVVVLAVPSSFVNRTAAVIVAVRLANQLAYNHLIALGLTGDALWQAEAVWQSLIYGAAILPALRYAATTPCFVSASLFIGLTAAPIAYLGGALTAAEKYWFVYALAVIQVLTIPFGNDWRRVAAFARTARADYRAGNSLRFAA